MNDTAPDARSPARAPHGPTSAHHRVGWPGRIVLLLVLVVGVLVGGAIAYVVSLPGVGDAMARSRQIARMHGEPERMVVPRRVALSVIAGEDDHFDDDVVFNIATGAGRAGLAVLDGNGNPGGATIDQQLAKAIYGTGGGTLGTLRQIGLGVKIGLRYSHHQVLEMYLADNYFGDGAWGISEAARRYFATAPGALSWARASLLAGLLQAPSAYDPFDHLALARARQRYVLGRLVADGTLSSRQAQTAARAPLGLLGS